MLPATILTGFLGSGKTTLLNNLLSTSGREKIAIIENEFGSVGVDTKLLNKSEDIQIIELSNGCICCSIRGELTESIKNLLAKIDANKLQIDRLIIETTGLADPAPIIQTFFLDDEIKERVALDAVITLVDAHHILKQLNEHAVAASQIGFADKIILTKSDTVTDEQKSAVLLRIHAINSKADILEVLNGKLPKEQWIGIKAFELDDTIQINGGSYKSTASNVSFTSFSTQNPTKSWNDSIKSYVFEAAELDIKKIGSFMEELVEEYGNDMLRYKGVFAIYDEPNPIIVQGVHKIVGFDYSDKPQDERKSLLVVIGRNLPYEKLLEGFLGAAT